MEQSKNEEMTLQEYLEKMNEHYSPSEMNKRLTGFVELVQEIVDARVCKGFDHSVLQGAIKLLDLADGYEKYILVALQDVKVNSKPVNVEIKEAIDEIVLSW